MKTLKKALVILLITAMAVSVLGISANAAQYENCADDLNSLGLFGGTGSGYDLDSAPTRIQAGIMLIRLLGQESAAKASTYSHPFTDVPSWADKYVGYLYGTGLAKGISETLFGTDDKCDVRMYSTFVLRALGYSDAKGDFQYSAAVDFGTIIGVVDYYIADGTFLRDNMVAISLLALNTQPKDKSAPTLLDKLVKDGAVTAAAAKPILDRFAAYEEYMSAFKDFENTERISVEQVTEYAVSMFGESFTGEQKTTIKATLENNYLLMSLISTIVQEDVSESVEIYYRDGYMFINSGGEKIKMESDIYDAQYLMTEAETLQNPLYQIKDIKETSSGLNTVYKITFSDSFVSDLAESTLSDSMLDELEAADDFRSASIKNLYVEVITTAAGKLVSQKLFVDLEMPVTVNGLKTMAGCQYTVTMKVLATGSGVTVSFPSDLNSYMKVS